MCTQQTCGSVGGRESFATTVREIDGDRCTDSAAGQRHTAAMSGGRRKRLPRRAGFPAPATRSGGGQKDRNCRNDSAITDAGVFSTDMSEFALLAGVYAKVLQTPAAVARMSRVGQCAEFRRSECPSKAQPVQIDRLYRTSIYKFMFYNIFLLLSIYISIYIDIVSVCYLKGPGSISPDGLPKMPYIIKL